MKSSTLVKGVLFGASLMLASAALAGEKAAIKIYEQVTVNGKTIAPGKYDAQWTGNGSDVQLTLSKGKEVVATLPAHIASAQSVYSSTGYSTKKEADGSRALTNVFFGGKKYSLQVGEEVAATPAAAKADGTN